MKTFNGSIHTTSGLRRTATELGILGLCAAALLVLAGCGKSQARPDVYPVQGKVEFNGKPTPGALVFLHPKGGDPDAIVPRAQVKPDGTFTASTFGTADGAPAGDYVVTVEWRKTVEKNGDFTVGPNLVPEKYSRPETSQIEVSVNPQLTELPTIKLKR